MSIKRLNLGMALGLIGLVFSPITMISADSLARSGTIQMEGEEIKLDWTIQGGTITSSTADGWQTKYFIEGTTRPGETLSIAVSGNGTSSNEVNIAQPATMTVWFEARHGTEKQEKVVLEPGESGSLASSFVVPEDAWRVKIYGSIGNTWVNPHGGGSRGLVLTAEFEVLDPEETTEQVEEEPLPVSPRPEEEEKICEAAGVVRFGDLYGEVNVRPNSEDDDAYIFAELSTPLCHDDRIKTLPRSGAILSFSDMATYVMKEDSIVVLDIKNERDTLIGLVAGKVWVNLKKMVEDGSMEVEMSQAVAGIKGTTLICEDDGSTSTIKVIEGTVEFRPNNGAPVTVTGGHMAVATAAGIDSIQAFSIEDEMSTWDKPTQTVTEWILEKNNISKVSPYVLGGLVLLVGGGVILFLRTKKRKRILS